MTNIAPRFYLSWRDMPVDKAKLPGLLQEALPGYSVWSSAEVSKLDIASLIAISQLKAHPGDQMADDVMTTRSSVSKLQQKCWWLDNRNCEACRAHRIEYGHGSYIVPD